MPFRPFSLWLLNAFKVRAWRALSRAHRVMTVCHLQLGFTYGLVCDAFKLGG